MIFDFEFWEIDINIDKTKKLYEEQDFSIDKKDNKEFIENLSDDNIKFFNSLGVDLNKVKIDKIIYNISEEKGEDKKICRIFVEFLLRGKFLSIPEYQREIYGEEDFFEDFPDNIKVNISEDKVPSFNIGIGSGIIFKHPLDHFNNEINLWNSGYVMGSLLIINK